MARWILLAIFAAVTVFYYYAMGPAPDAADLMEDFLPWWKTRGWLTESLRFRALADFAREGRIWIPLALFLVPVLGLWLSTLRATRSAVLRAIAFTLLMVSGAFVVWGFRSLTVWTFLGWRFPAVIATCALLIALVAYAPSLLASARRLSIGAAVLVAVGFAALVFGLSTEVTGTNSEMPANVSPWPFVNYVGLMYCGLTLAALHVGAGAGAALGQGRKGGYWIAAGIGGVVACALTPFALGPVSEAGPTAVQYAAFFVLGAGYAAVFGQKAPDPEAPTPSATAGMRLAAGLACMAAIGLSYQAAVGFQTRARNQTATRVLVALEAYKHDHDTYPDKLEELVPDYLADVPRPRIGLWLNEDDRFTYSNFGDSYALEFASVLWEQCQYNPPYEFADYGDDEEELEVGFEGDAANAPVSAEPVDPALAVTLAEHGLDGAWSCQERPPKLL